MLYNLRYFFRGTPDSYVFPQGSLNHMLLIFIALLGVELIIHHRNRLKDPKHMRVFKKAMIIILSIQQIVLYLWYGFSGYFTIKESLPLYNCRIAIIFTILAFITDKKLFKNVVCYWGITGSILALALPATDPFIFPHYTIVSFFVGHMFMLWSAIYLLVVEEYRISKKSLVSILYFTNIYHICVYIFNSITKSNYCYLMEAPFAKEAFINTSSLMYSFFAFLSFNIFMLIFYLITKTIYRVLEKDEDLANYA